MREACSTAPSSGILASVASAGLDDDVDEVLTDNPDADDVDGGETLAIAIVDDDDNDVVDDETVTTAVDVGNGGTPGGGAAAEVDVDVALAATVPLPVWLDAIPLFFFSCLASPALAAAGSLPDDDAAFLADGVVAAGAAVDDDGAATLGSVLAYNGNASDVEVPSAAGEETGFIDSPDIPLISACSSRSMVPRH